MDKKVLVVGAGNIGTLISIMLSHQQYDVTLIDNSLEALSKDVLKDIKILCFDITDEDKLLNVMKEVDYVVNASPFFLNKTIATNAAIAEAHYFDLTEDIDQINYIKGLAKNGNSAFVPQCGLAPGFISIITNHLLKKFDSVQDVKMRVGALPINPNNRLKYNLTWSVDGLVNEYLKPCNAIRNKKSVQLTPLEGYETFSLDGHNYEAFNTSGGLSTLYDAWSGRVENLDYKSIRYPGHCELIKFLTQDLSLDGNELKSIFKKSIPTTKQDVVIIFVSVTGYKDDKFIQETWARKIYNDTRYGANWSAIQLTTSSGICTMLELHNTGKLPKTGFITHEEVNFAEFMTPRVSDVYE